MRTLEIRTAEVFEPLLQPSRYKGAHGGRGSGKSHFFAELLIEDCLAEPGESGEGMRAVCIREVQKDLAQSSKLLIESKLSAFGLTEADGFKVFRDVIQTPKDGVMIFKGMNDYTADSVKSLEGFKRAWWEEAQTATQHSLNLLRPTLRAQGSQLWFGWNPRRKLDPVDKMLRGVELPTGAVVVQANWRDNPWFTPELEQERLDCLRMQPDQYDHIWEGGYVSVVEGAYFAKSLSEAKSQGRIGRVAADPLLTLRAFVDIGGTGAKADNFVIWIAQFVGREIRILDHYEAQGQPIGAHLDWMRGKGYVPGKCQFWLPHDGDTQDKVHDVSYRSALEQAGYAVDVVPNQGKGAASQRVEAVRRLFPAMWFNEATTQGGLDALGWYHEKRDEARGIGLGPDHDWSSHSCFHPDTRLLTRYGTCRIMDLPKYGEVLTPCGWKQYIHPRITKKAARLVEVVFASGYSVKCTPDHLFLTDGGWKSAESLTRDSLIRSSLTGSRNSSEGAFIGFGRLIATTQKAVAGFIAMCGRQLLGQFRPVATSTTGTATLRTTGWRTWSALTPRSISEWSETLLRGTSQELSATKREKRPLSGIGPWRGESGTSDKPSVRSRGLSGNVSRNAAPNAKWSFKLSSAKAAIHRFIAALSARLLRTVSAGSKTNGLLRIARVKQLSEVADVWDITVPDGHIFSLENGAVVHNCDAFGLMAVVYEQPQPGGPQPIKYRNRVTA